MRDGRELAADHAGVHGRQAVRPGVQQWRHQHVRHGPRHTLLRLIHLLLLLPRMKIALYILYTSMLLLKYCLAVVEQVVSPKHNLTQDRIAATQERFNRIHQAASVCILSACPATLSLQIAYQYDTTRYEMLF